jgi:hypothetical protein
VVAKLGLKAAKIALSGFDELPSSPYQNAISSQTTATQLTPRMPRNEAARISMSIPFVKLRLSPVSDAIIRANAGTDLMIPRT